MDGQNRVRTILRLVVLAHLYYLGAVVGSAIIFCIPGYGDEWCDGMAYIGVMDPESCKNIRDVRTERRRKAGWNNPHLSRGATPPRVLRRWPTPGEILNERITKVFGAFRRLTRGRTGRKVGLTKFLEDDSKVKDLNGTVIEALKFKGSARAQEL